MLKRETLTINQRPTIRQASVHSVHSSPSPAHLGPTNTSLTRSVRPSVLNTLSYRGGSNHSMPCIRLNKCQTPALEGYDHDNGRVRTSFTNCAWKSYFSPLVRTGPLIMVIMMVAMMIVMIIPMFLVARSFCRRKPNWVLRPIPI